jgi:hypothetical protein
MSDLSTIDSPAVADAYSFGEIHSIVDVGAGTDFSWRRSWRGIRA